MKFPWSKPSAYEVVKALFDEFTPEEIAILDGNDCAIPHMYSFLLESSKRSELDRDWELGYIKSLMLNLFSKREQIRDPKFQTDLFRFFTNFHGLPKVNTKKYLGMEEEEALAFITDFLKEEGFDEEVVKGFSEWVEDDIRGKVTIHEKDVFKELVKLTVRELREHLKNKSYREPCWRMSMFFQDKPKSRMSMFVDRNSHYIVIALSIASIVLSVILKFT